MRLKLKTYLFLLMFGIFQFSFGKSFSPALNEQGQWYIIDDKCKQLFTINNGCIFEIDWNMPIFQNGYAKFREVSSRSIGFIDTTGKISIKPKYRFAMNFSDGLCAIKLPGKKGYGFINKIDSLIIPPQFESANCFKFNRALVSDGTKYWFIDKSGKAIFYTRYIYVSSFAEGLVPFYINNDMQNSVCFVDTSGKPIFKTNFPYCGNFSDQRAIVLTNDNKVGYIDRNGTIKVPLSYQAKFGIELEKYPKYNDGRCFGYSNNGWVLIDNEGNIVCKTIFEDVSNFSEGLCAVKINGKWGYIDKSGKIIIKPTFYRVQDFQNGIANVQFEQEIEPYTRINRNGVNICK